MFTIGPLIGWARDYTQSFTFAISLLSLSMAACALPWLIEMSLAHFRKSRNAQPIPDDDCEQTEINELTSLEQ